MTVLDRLARKGAVRRELGGKVWYYTPTHTREEHIARLMLDALDLAGSRDEALAHFARSVTADEAATPTAGAGPHRTVAAARLALRGAPTSSRSG